MDQLVIYF